MKPTLLAIGCALTLSACDAPTASMDVTAASPLIGRELVAENGDTFLFYPDGTIGGMLQGEDIVGVYTADGTEICSTYSSPDRLVGTEFCSTPAIDGDVVIFNRRDGSTSQAYAIQG